MKESKFAFVLGNFDLVATFAFETNVAVCEIDRSFRKKTNQENFKIKSVKTTNPGRSVLKIETNSLVELSDLADVVHEIFPRHGIAVLPWEMVEIK